MVRSALRIGFYLEVLSFGALLRLTHRTANSLATTTTKIMDTHLATVLHVLEVVVAGTLFNHVVMSITIAAAKHSTLQMYNSKITDSSFSRLTQVESSEIVPMTNNIKPMAPICNGVIHCLAC